MLDGVEFYRELTRREPRLATRVIFVSGVARSFLQPARQALASEIVPRAVLPNAVTWRSIIWQGAAVAGPAADSTRGASRAKVHRTMTRP